MTIHDVEQGSEMWHELRNAKIGGTRSKGLFVKSDTLLFELLAEYTESYQSNEDDYMSDDMARGIFLEPIARAQIELYTGLKFNQIGYIISDIPNLAISPDGLTECKTIACEIKCPGAKKHVQTCIEDEIPLDNIHQCLHYFTVIDTLKELYFVSYREEALKKLFVKKITLDSEINLGTKSRPLIKPVTEWVKIAKEEAALINKQLNELVIKLTF